MADDVFIVSAKRTPQGRFLGAFAKHSAAELGVVAAGAVLKGVGPSAIDRVIVGNVISAGQKLNVARQIALRVEVPQDRPAFTVNMACASGMLAVSLAAQAIRGGESQVVLCGGAESMSSAPHLLLHARHGYKLGNGDIADSLLHDGFLDPIHGEHMGNTAERLASEYKIDRIDQDAFALRSQQRTARATSAGIFARQIVAVDGVAIDEHPRPDTTADTLAQLSPVFDQAGTVTAGNASGINDGAAMLVVAGAKAVARHGWKPMAKIVGASEVGCDARRMGLGPVYATRALCERFGCSIERFDTVELNEAFAGQTLACLRELGLPSDAEHVNPHGGAIALGHPVGASGARLLVHLAHSIARGEIRHGLATLCVGGGMGAATFLTAPEGC